MAKEANKRGNSEGSIRQRPNGTWEAAITVGRTDAGNPRRRHVYGATRQEASAKLAELLTKQAQGGLVEPSKMSVREVAERWLRNQTGLSAKSQDNYPRELALVLAEIGEIRVQQLRTAQVRDAYTALAERGLSVQAQRKAALHLRSVLRDGVHEGILQRNVADGVRVSVPRVPPAAQAWTAAETSTFLVASTVQANSLFPVFYVMPALGLRRGEALGLPWEAVDLDRGTVRIHQASKVEPSGAVSVGEVKTGNSRRTLILTDDVISVLRNQQKRQQADRNHAGGRVGGIGPGVHHRVGQAS